MSDSGVDDSATPSVGQQRESSESGKGTQQKSLLEFLLAIVAISTFFFGVIQYQRAQRWQKGEFAAQELDRLTREPLLQLALQVVDWPRRQLVLPSDYRVLAGDSGFFRHDWSRLEQTLRGASGLIDDRAYGSVEMNMYVDAVERLLDYFDRIDHYVQARLIEPEDVSPLSYWLERAMSRPAIREYKELWEYDRVDSLAKRLSGLR